MGLLPKIGFDSGKAKPELFLKGAQKTAGELASGKPPNLRQNFDNTVTDYVRSGISGGGPLNGIAKDHTKFSSKKADEGLLVSGALQTGRQFLTSGNPAALQNGAQNTAGDYIKSGTSTDLSPGSFLSVLG